MSECELCGAPGEMDFNAVVPLSDGRTAMVRGDLCLSCWGDYPDDTAIVIALLTKRQERDQEGEGHG